MAEDQGPVSRGPLGIGLAAVRNLVRTLVSPPDLNGLKGHYYLIDFARGLSAVAILFWHYQHFFIPRGLHDLSPEGLNGEPLASVFYPLYHYGLHAVELFWMISGFIFTAVYAARKATTRDFVVNRFARLYPLHFITLIVVALLQIAARASVGSSLIFGNNDWYHFALQLGFASNWGFNEGLSFNGPIWSISVEVLIYAAFWIVLPVLLRRGILGPAILCVFTLALAIAFPPNTIAMCGFFFFLGSAIFLIHRAIQGQLWLHVLFAAGFGSVAILNLGLMARPNVTTIVLPGLFGGVLLLLAGLEATHMSRWLRPTRWLGDCTYGIYLWHVPFQIALLLAMDLSGIGQGIVRSPWFLLFFLTTTIAMARLSYLWIERPARVAIRHRADRRESPDPRCDATDAGLSVVKPTKV